MLFPRALMAMLHDSRSDCFNCSLSYIIRISQRNKTHAVTLGAVCICENSLCDVSFCMQYVKRSPCCLCFPPWCTACDACSCHMDWCFFLAPGDPVWNNGWRLWSDLIYSFAKVCFESHRAEQLDSNRISVWLLLHDLYVKY